VIMLTAASYGRTNVALAESPVLTASAVRSMVSAERRTRTVASAAREISVFET